MNSDQVRPGLRFHGRVCPFPSTAGLTLAVLFRFLAAEPVVIRGSQLPSLLGTPITHFRMCDASGRAIPFQIDELTSEGEYVCDQGNEPNADSGNGILDELDEIVFMREDCSECATDDHLLPPCENRSFLPVRTGGDGKACRIAYCTGDTSITLLTVGYITYDHSTQSLQTPRYFARFGTDRFHFTSAGIMDGKGPALIRLTRELRIEISLKAIWGLLPLKFTEDNLVCFVKRYKCGPVRLIRRGDFHLRIGLGIKGSRAAVNQICYPDMVQVPVSVHLPVRFRNFFREAFIEMSPVIDSAGIPFTISVPECRIAENVSGKEPVDHLTPCAPEGKMFTFLNQKHLGYGWLLQSDLPGPSEGSGFVFRRPSSRGGYAEFGYRLTLRDIPRGRYAITNWVLFSSGSPGTLEAVRDAIEKPATVETGGNGCGHHRIHAGLSHLSGKGKPR